MSSSAIAAKKSAKRAFGGLVGRFSPEELTAEPLIAPVLPPAPTVPLALVPPPAPTKRPRGRPRQHDTDAAKQARYRERQGREAKIQEAFAEHPDSRGQFLSAAPRSKGLLVSGGYDSAKVSRIRTAHDKKEELGGVQVRPSGHGHDTAFSTKETDRTFMYRFRFPKKWSLSKQEIEELIENVAQTTFEGVDPSSLPFAANARLSWNFDSFRCRECGFETRGWRNVIDHLTAEHSKIVRRCIREAQPRFPKAPNKPRKCIINHEASATRLKAQGEFGPIYCDRCGTCVLP